ncbi:hypothetical protein [Dehalobacter restrictus]|uniref:hypothetical protein n=1 Tax=Dehalobacter restrictus TaxID=55583 RepID=UPI00338F2E2D
MQIFTIHNLVILITATYQTFKVMKNTIVAALFTNLWQLLSDVLHGNLTMIISLIGTVVLIWKLKSWIISFVAGLIVHG